jgi:asparagine synthetase B (glutamine-hydrolysing)
MSSSSGSNLDKIAIRNILSIRYNPLEKPFIKPAKWQDYTNEVYNNARDKLQELLVKSTLDKLSDQKTIAISLSGGIDSTLCLGLIRHVFPEKKVIGICGVFAGGFDESIVAKRVADKFNADFHIVHMESVFTHMPEIITIHTPDCKTCKKIHQYPGHRRWF